MQSVYFLPQERRVSEGEELSLTVCHDDYSLWYSVQSCRYRPNRRLLLQQWSTCFVLSLVMQNSTSKLSHRPQK